jgi:hypothetical protein
MGSLQIYATDPSSVIAECVNIDLQLLQIKTHLAIPSPASPYVCWTGKDINGRPQAPLREA